MATAANAIITFIAVHNAAAFCDQCLADIALKSAVCFHALQHMVIGAHELVSGLLGGLLLVVLVLVALLLRRHGCRA